MKYIFSTKNTVAAGLGILLGMILVSSFMSSLSFREIGSAFFDNSVELGIARLSPDGHETGYAVPASGASQPPPVGTVNGQCAATHYQCAAGVSANNVENQNSWTWQCNGTGGGTNSNTCTEIKSAIPAANVTFLWTLISNPVGSSPTIVNGTTLTPTFSGLTATGTYTFRLTATDGSGLSAFDDTTVTVFNEPPEIFAGVDKEIELYTGAADAEGAYANDDEGSPVTLIWTNTVRPTGARDPEIRRGTTLTPTFSGLDTLGTYTFRLTGTDNVNLSASDSMNVIVNPDSCATPPCNVVTTGPTGELWAYHGTDPEVPVLGIPLGDSAYLIWDTEDAVSCTISNNVDGTGQSGLAVDNLRTDGLADYTVTPTVRTTYFLSCRDAGGTLHLIDTAIVDPTGGIPPGLDGTPRIVDEGDPGTLTWNLNGQIGCTLRGGPATVYDQTYLEANSTVTVQVNARTVYTLQCASGSDTFTFDVVARHIEN